MIADKITLTLIYDTLFRIEQNIGPVFEIRVAATSQTNRKSYILKDLKDLKRMVDAIKTINNIDSPSTCFLDNEEVYNLISFGITKKDLTRKSKDAQIYVDTAIDLSVAKEIPSAHMKDLNDLRSVTDHITALSRTATCHAYIENAFEYIQETYVEAVKNKPYNLLTQAYKKYVNKNVI